MAWFWESFWDQAKYDDLIARLNNLRANQLLILSKLNAVLQKESDMAVDLAGLTTEVQRNADVTASVVQLVHNLADQIAAIPASSDATTQAALDALRATLTSNDDAIAAAVVQNTPAQP